MILNITLQHYAGFLLVAAIATIFFKGWQLVRVISWTFLWQLITPARDWLIDGLMLGVGFWITELIYVQLRFRK
jgi:hypothetical protein